MGVQGEEQEIGGLRVSTCRASGENSSCPGRPIAKRAVERNVLLFWGPDCTRVLPLEPLNPRIFLVSLFFAPSSHLQSSKPPPFPLQTCASPSSEFTFSFLISFFLFPLPSSFALPSLRVCFTRTFHTVQSSSLHPFFPPSRFPSHHVHGTWGGILFGFEPV